MLHAINIIFYIVNIYSYFLLANILLSWLPFLMKYKFFRIISKIGGWFLEPFTGYLVLGPIDFTPILAFMVYDVVTYGAMQLLTSL